MEKNQRYFLTKECQEKLKQSQKDLEEGNFIIFDTHKELADYLEKASKEK